MVRGSSRAMTSGPFRALRRPGALLQATGWCAAAPERGVTPDPPKGSSTGGPRPATMRPCRSRPGLPRLAIAGAAAWLIFTTPILARVVVFQSGSAGGALVGAMVWAIALTAPACFAVLGIARLAAAAQHVRGTRRRTPPVTRRAALLPPGCSVIARIVLPDGRRIPDVVVGPHGVAFFEQLPPAAAARRTGERWEVRFSDRVWRPIENPLQRATRDAERLRRHLEAEERDFVVRVTAVVLGDEHDVARTEGCAVVALDDVPGWLVALPAQRGLTADRLAHLRAVLEALA
jgi:hypothetical protein